MVYFKRRWVWLNLVVLGVISPLFNSYHNYSIGLEKLNDVGRLLEFLPAGIVHGYFWLTMSAYLVGLVIVFTLSRTARTKMEQERHNS